MKILILGASGLLGRNWISQMTSISDMLCLIHKNDINNNKITLEYITKLPYVRDNGCFKYYDFKNLVSWYVRGSNIVTIVQYEKIAIIRRIITDVYHLQFNEYCRDHTFGTCNRGCKCKFKHIDLNTLYKYQNPNLQILKKFDHSAPEHFAVQQIYMVHLKEAKFCLKNKILFPQQAMNQDLLN